MKQRGAKIKVQSKGYGGNHIGDAGYLTINRDVPADVDVCFLEWSTPEQKSLPREKFLYMLDILHGKSILPIVLILARKDNIAGDREFDRELLKLCEENDVKVLDYRSLIVPDVDLRDAVHTKESGALKYSQAIIDELSSIQTSLESWKPPRGGPLAFSINSLSELTITLEEGQALEFDVEVLGENAEVIAEVVRGPASGVIDVLPEKLKIKVWDRWSHFERPSFLSICKFEGVNNFVQRVTIAMTEDSVDYSHCARPFSYDGPKNFKLKSLLLTNCVAKNDPKVMHSSEVI
ncbi:hypothetical protein [uncultured Umboniibacter sp.]|uniref:hypothetical protein n=1 Tax=uncultured Umboniibacter sp. TaxID=1798917 RepID=UPI00261ACAD0|nr:hypothetical protein [uncultured Umboniibacter sp.]